MDIILKIRKELRANVDEAYIKSSFRFFKEKIKCYGVRTPIVRKISAKYFAEAKDKKKDEIFDLCEKLLASDFNEEATIAFDWAHRLEDGYAERDFKIFENWIGKYVNNWAKCDDFCNHSVGGFLEKYPAYLEKIKTWTKSKNRWMRRAAAVSLILPARRGKFLPDIFWISDVLLQDPDDLVQKGYGWMLKEASKANPEKVFAYVMKNKNKMPRTALRYAIEKMPKEKKMLAVEK